jgi:hypothetical protein
MVCSTKGMDLMNIETRISGKKIVITEQHGGTISTHIINTDQKEIIDALVKLGWGQPIVEKYFPIPDTGWID